MNKTRDESPEPQKEPEKVVEPAVQPTPPVVQEIKTERILMSGVDAYVADRMKSQPSTIEEVESLVKEDVGDKPHRLTLPPELDSFRKKFAFRWLFKHKQNLDYQCDARGWVLVHRAHFGDLPEHLFSVNGSIERGDTILAFMPVLKAEGLREEPGQKSIEAIKAMMGRHKDNPNYYAPDEVKKTDELGSKGVMI